MVLTDEGAAAFQHWCAGRNDGDLLFVRDDGQPWRIPNQDCRIRMACKRAGIVPPISFHCLRHTYASLAVMNGAPLLVVAKNLGHTDTRMVERHYGHMAQNFVADAIRAAAPRFGLKPSKAVRVIRG